MRPAARVASSPRSAATRRTPPLRSPAPRAAPPARATRETPMQTRAPRRSISELVKKEYANDPFMAGYAGPENPFMKPPKSGGGCEII